MNTFDELRYFVYSEKHFVFSIECFPSTSDSIRQQILRAYLQCYKRLQSPVLEDIELDPVQYGYWIDKKENWFQLFLPNLQCPATSPTHIRAKSAVDLRATSVEYLISHVASTANVNHQLTVKILSKKLYSNEFLFILFTVKNLLSSLETFNCSCPPFFITSL